uniref:Senescence-associated protein n=1 Tax=Salix viminalis TaxID=40686 RepID=A0A6N2NG35_SALVM
MTCMNQKRAAEFTGIAFAAETADTAESAAIRPLLPPSYRSCTALSSCARPGNSRPSLREAVLLERHGLNLSGSWQQGHSATYNTPSRFYPPLGGNCTSRRPRGSSTARAWPTARASGAKRPLLQVGNRTAGARVASSPDSDLEAFSHNPTHGSFAPLAFQPSAMTNCANQRFLSKSAMNAWLPQASYPCGNFSDTSSFKFRRSKGSIGHAFTVRIRTGNQNQTSFYPFVPHEISVLVELILGHLRYLLTDVPPQPNSPPDNVFRPDRPPKRPWVQKEGSAPPPIHGISKITLKVVVFHLRRSSTYPTPLKSFHKVGLESSSTGSSFPLIPQAVPWLFAIVDRDNDEAFGYLKRVIVTPPFTRAWLNFFTLTFRALGRNHIARIPLVRTSSESTVRRPGRPRKGRSQSVPGRHATTRSRRGSSSSSPPTADGFGTGTPSPALRANPFPERLFTLETDAVMSTAWEALGPPDFQGPPGRTGHHATCGALPAAGPYLRLSRFQGILTRFPFEARARTRCRTGFPRLLGSTNPCASAVHMEPFPLRPSKFSFEYLLLPPRSAPTAAPPGSRLGFAATAAPSYSSGPGACPTAGYRSRASAHPFRLVDSAADFDFHDHRPAVSAQLGTVTGFRFIPHRQFCLPKMAHLELSIPWHGSTKQPRRPTYLKFENRSRALRPDASNHWLYLIELAPSSSYPEGNFGGNQLLDGSISLSPYTQVRRTICTSVSLRASTRVSSGFARSGIVHHLSVRQHALTRTLLRRSRSVGGATLEGIPPVSFLAPYGFTRHSLVRVSRRDEWGATGRCRSAHSTIAATASPQAFQRPGLGRHRDPHRSTPEPIGGPAVAVPHPTGAHRRPHPLPSRQFQALFDSLFKVLFIFPSRYLFAIGLSPYLALDGIYADGLHSKQPDSQTAPRGAAGSSHDGALTLSGAPSRGLGPGPPLRTLLQTTIRTPRAPDSQAGHFPVRSPLLGESLASLKANARGPGGPGATSTRTTVSEGLSTTACRGNRRRGLDFRPTRAGARGRPVSARLVSEGSRRASTGVGATCVQRLDGSRDSAIHTKYRISLRSSSMREPRYPLPRVVQIITKRRRAPTRGYEGGLLVLNFLGASRAGVRWRAVSGADASSTARVDTRGGCPEPSLSCHGFAGRSAGAGFDNDPSAGSPTETLLRLLLPLNDKVQWTSRDVASGEPPRRAIRTLHRTFNRRSDGRPTIAMIYPITMKFQRLPGPVGQGYRLVEYISVARVRPRTSKGITDLLLPQTSLAWKAIVPLRSWPRRNQERALSLSILTMSGPGAGGVLKATSANPWSASFMVETRTLFVFHKSKNFTSDYEIRMPRLSLLIITPIPKANRIGSKSYDVIHANHSNFFKVTAPEARPGQLRPGAHRGRRDEATGAHLRRTATNQNLPSNGSSLRDLDCTHSNYQTRRAGIVIYCHYLPCQDWVICAPAAFLGCGSRFSGSSPESNPNSPSPVTPCYHESSEQRAEPASTFYLINASFQKSGFGARISSRITTDQPGSIPWRQHDPPIPVAENSSSGAETGEEVNLIEHKQLEKAVERAEAQRRLHVLHPRARAIARGPVQQESAQLEHGRAARFARAPGRHEAKRDTFTFEFHQGGTTVRCTSTEPADTDNPMTAHAPPRTRNNNPTSEPRPREQVETPERDRAACLSSEAAGQDSAAGASRHEVRDRGEGRLRDASRQFNARHAGYSPPRDPDHGTPRLARQPGLRIASRSRGTAAGTTPC